MSCHDLASGKHLGGIWEASGRRLGDTWEASGRHLGARGTRGTASGRHLGARGTRGTPGGSQTTSEAKRWKQNIVFYSIRAHPRPFRVDETSVGVTVYRAWRQKRGGGPGGVCQTPRDGSLPTPPEARQPKSSLGKNVRHFRLSPEQSV